MKSGVHLADPFLCRAPSGSVPLCDFLSLGDHLGGGASLRAAGRAIAAPGAGKTVNGQTVATVTNAAGQSITSIVITNSTVTSAVTNAGTITPGINVPGTGATEGVFVGQSTILGGVLNSGTITAVGKGSDTLGIFITGSSVSAGSASGAVVNSGSILASEEAPTQAR